MGYLFLTVGVLLVLIFAPFVFRQITANRTAPSLFAEPEQNPENRLGEAEGLLRRGELQEQIAELREELIALSTELKRKASILQSNSSDNGSEFYSCLQTAFYDDPGSEDASEEGGATSGWLQRQLAVTEQVSDEMGQPHNKEKAAPERATVQGQSLSLQKQISQAHAGGESIDSLAQRFGRGKGEIKLILGLHRLRKT